MEKGFPGGSEVKNPPANAGDLGSIPGLGSSLGGERGNPLQYSCLENLVFRGDWQATVHWVTKSHTQLKQLSNKAYMATKPTLLTVCTFTETIG